nr:hypothetical protein [Methanosarcina siciliae]
MFKEAKALGLPEPEIIEVGMRVRFIVHLAESIVVETTGLVLGEGGSQSKLRLESRLAAKVLILLRKMMQEKATTITQSLALEIMEI